MYKNAKLLNYCVKMKLNRFAVVIFLLFAVSMSISAQQPNEIDIPERAANEADRLQQLLDLEDWQTFYVDSTLQHDFAAMMAEIDELAAAKVTNHSMYIMVQDAWMEQIDKTYRRIFNDEQWAAYMKTGAAKAQKMREKRKAKANANK